MPCRSWPIFGGLVAAALAVAVPPPVAAQSPTGGIPIPDLFDPFAFDPLSSTWDAGLYADIGVFAPQSGTWDELVQHGLTTAIGGTWKFADWSGDLLPPSSTFFQADYRYAFLKGDDDVQLYGPGGFVGNVREMRLHLGEFGVRQRFPGLLRGRTFFEFGATVGMGVADGLILPAVVTPGDEPVFVTARNEDGFIIRGEVNSAAGLQFGRIDVRFGTAYGWSGSDALSGGFRSQGDFGARLSGTIYFDR